MEAHVYSKKINVYKLKKLMLCLMIAVLIMITIFFTSCNSKTKIVEQEIEVKRRIALIDSQINFLGSENDTLRRTHNDSVNGKWDEYFAINKRFNDSAQLLTNLKKPLYATYDSLEMELKKY